MVGEAKTYVSFDVGDHLRPIPDLPRFDTVRYDYSAAPDITRLFVFKLVKGKFFVGRTKKDVEHELSRHRAGDGHPWSAKFPPVRGDDATYFSTEISHNAEEDAMTERLMHEFGVENVRGGTYKQMTLPEHLEKTLNDKFRCWEDECFVCKKVGHFSRQCPDWETRIVDAEKKANEFSDKFDIGLSLLPGAKTAAQRELRPWTTEENTALKLALESWLYSIKQIATRHNRTEGEIRLRKQELGLGQTFNTMNPQLANVFINKAVDRRLIHNTMH